MNRSNLLPFIILCSSALSCSCGNEAPKDSMLERTTVAKEQELEQLHKQAEQDSMPPEVRKETEKRIEKRSQVIEEELKTSKYQVLTPSQIEDTLEKWVASYESNRSSTELEKIKTVMMRDAAIMQWGNDNILKRKALQDRVMAVQKTDK